MINIIIDNDKSPKIRINLNFPDTLHLNVAGLRLFGSVIKNAIFYRKKSHSEGGTGGGNRMQQDGRIYSSALSDTGRRGRRKGGVNSCPRQPQ